MLATFFGYYGDWELGDKVTFDGPNRLIIVNPGVTDLDIKTDVYSAWKRWVTVSGDNAGFLPAIRTTGGDPTIGAQSAGDIYFMINNWRLQIDFAETTVTGILFSDDNATAYVDDQLNDLTPAIVSSTVNTVATGPASSTDLTPVLDAIAALNDVDLTLLPDGEIKDALIVINGGVKKSSLLIPHTDDIA